MESFSADYGQARMKSRLCPNEIMDRGGGDIPLWGRLGFCGNLR
jgi:hypothetical protein